MTIGRGFALGFLAALPPLAVDAESPLACFFDLRSALDFAAAVGLGMGSGGGLRIVPALLFWGHESR